jgi:hypothetical protein
MTFDEHARREAATLHARVRSVIEHDFQGNETFDTLAAAIASYQARRSPGYARLCEARGVDCASASPRALPAVPTDAFRLARVATFPESQQEAVFHTSGTTETTPGRHAMRTLETYRAASLAWARRTLFAPYGTNRSVAPLVLAIAASPTQAPHSSLSRMMGWFVEEIGAPGSRFLSPEALDEIRACLEEAQRPVVLLATAFAYVHLIDAHLRVALPLGSRAMQTGGFKGRSREIAPEELRSAIADSFALTSHDVVGEYGMTELSSQLYAVTPAEEDPARWIYRAPPWVRVVAADPSSLAPLAAGHEGIARIEDLANVESAWAIQTVDRVRVSEDGGVELLGRLPGASPRGCSLAVEELLGERR